jgi:catechol 2,3-dioxygenase-like lactoylglutathione lyase family enzyme
LFTGTFHVGFSVADMNRSLAFYRDILGFELLVDMNWTAPYLGQIVGYPGAYLHRVFLRLPNTEVRLELIEYREPRGTVRPLETKDPGNGHICLFVEDLRKTFADLKAKGVRFRSEEPVEITEGVNKGSLAAYLNDPDGIAMELIQPAPTRTG